MKYDLVKSLRTLSCVSVFVGRTNCTRHLGRYSDGNHTCEYCCMTHLCNVETIESELASDCLTKLGPVKSSAMTLTAFTWWPFVALGVLLLIAAIGDRWSRLENADFLAIAAPLSFWCSAIDLWSTKYFFSLTSDDCRVNYLLIWLINASLLEKSSQERGHDISSLLILLDSRTL